jgi:hypothetical protein
MNHLGNTNQNFLLIQLHLVSPYLILKNIKIGLKNIIIFFSNFQLLLIMIYLQY